MIRTLLRWLLPLSLAWLALACGAREAAPPREDPTEATASEEDLFGIGHVGLLNPEDLHQRYRRPEYPSDKSFYQWWYFAVRDVRSGRHFAFAYNVLDAVHRPELKSARMLFTMTDLDAGTRFWKIEKHPLEQLKVASSYDLRVQGASLVEPAYGMETLPDGRHRVRGHMLAVAADVEVDGNLDGQPVDAAIEVSWDLTLTRINGWYGGKGIEGLDRKTGVIGWNPYGHATQVEGSLQVGGRLYQVEAGPSFRAYCDMNWGIEFPQGKPDERPVDYSWGWYIVGVPSANPEDEISIAAATGVTHVPGPDIKQGTFMDVRLGKKASIQTAGGEIFKSAPDGSGIKVFNTTDGYVRHFDVARDQWTAFRDTKGTALIPLHQRVTLETWRHTVVLDYYSKLEQYNRLPFAAEDYVFSDFEALGVDVHVVVTKRAEVLADFWSKAGGVEFGYRAEYP